MTDAPLVAITFHLSDGSTVPITEPQPLVYLDTLRRKLDKRLSGEVPAPVQDEDGVWSIPAGDHVFRVGTDDAGSLIPVGHIVRVTWEAVVPVCWCGPSRDGAVMGGPCPRHGHPPGGAVLDATQP